MNRAERRKMMRENGIRTKAKRQQYESICGGVASSYAAQAVGGLEAAFRKKWEKAADDETLNDGYKGEDEDGSDESDNC